VTDAPLEALLGAIMDAKPQSHQRRELIRRLLHDVVDLATKDSDTLDLKIAEASLKELLEAFEVFAPYRDIRKVTIFGSARTPVESPLYQLAHEFARDIADQEWMVVTGAGPGIMAAGIEGAGRERAFGVNIRLPFEQGANEFIVDDDKLVEMRYFFTRKVALTKESSAFAVFPGGFGTLDECYELLTLLQTGKAMPAPVVLFDTPEGNYWSGWQQFIDDHVVANGYVSLGDERFFSRVTSAREGVAVIRNFYNNYHSMRMVGDRVVVRLRRAPTSEQLAELNNTYASMVDHGTIESTGPLPAERSTNDVPELPRLVWHFNRRDFGALRRLIDDVNTWPSGS
jgi:uncharacterized protein (TIGR00730 family)